MRKHLSEHISIYQDRRSNYTHINDHINRDTIDFSIIDLQTGTISLDIDNSDNDSNLSETVTLFLSKNQLITLSKVINNFLS
jgi:hypothetical protein